MKGNVINSFKRVVDLMTTVTNRVSELFDNVANLRKKAGIVDKTDPLGFMDASTGFVSSFDSIYCMGDGSTVGALPYVIGNRSYEYYNEGTAYPSVLRSFGLNASNYGWPDETAKDYYQHVENSIANNEDFLKDAKAVIIALGAVDLIADGQIAHRFDGDPDTDIDLSDYTQNADNSVGGYARLIQIILERQPRARIFCCCLPNTISTEPLRTEANLKIKAIAEMFPDNCFVMDFQTYGVKEEDVSEWKEKYYSGDKPNALGYNLFARMVLSYMNWIIANNMDKFRDIGFIGTDYEYIDSNDSEGDSPVSDGVTEQS